MGEGDHRLSPACAWWFCLNEADVTFFYLIVLALFEDQDFARPPMGTAPIELYRHERPTA